MKANKLKKARVVGMNCCTGCETHKNVKFERHPLLNVLICEDCHTRYGDGDFTKYENGVDEDGDDNYCRWCADGGDLMLCKCHKGFCTECVERNLGTNTVSDIKDAANWSCFACDPSQLEFLVDLCEKALPIKSAPDEEDGESSEKEATRVGRRKKRTRRKTLEPVRRVIRKRICEEADEEYNPKRARRTRAAGKREKHERNGHQNGDSDEKRTINEKETSQIMTKVTKNGIIGALETPVLNTHADKTPDASISMFESFTRSQRRNIRRLENYKLRAQNKELKEINGEGEANEEDSEDDKSTVDGDDSVMVEFRGSETPAKGDVSSSIGWLWNSARKLFGLSGPHSH